MDLSSNKGKEPEIILTPEEKHIYRQLFLAADEEKKGVVTGQSAVKFFGKSGLESTALSSIWQIADSENKGFLTKQTFSIAVKLIAQVQNGGSLDPAKVNADVPLPRFEGVHVEPYQKLGGPGNFEPNNKPHNIITDEDREKYKDMFYKLSPTNGILDGGKTRDFFMRSKLSVEILSQIWILADTKGRGQLDLPEFIIAMHLIQQTMKGTIKSLPSELPSGFYEMASGAVTRNLSSPKPGQSPIIRHMTLDSDANSQSIFQDNSWDVSEKDKASYDQLFNTLDENKRGHITGGEAASFFMKSKLSSDQLALIWDLADINKSGHLSRDEFAVAMYLITKKLAGVPLPTSLPNSLVPPSMRTASPFTDLKRSVTMGHKPSRSQNSSDLGSFFDSFHQAAPSSPFFSSTTSQPGSEFDLLGDTDMSTKIALESGEIKNYQSQSDNLKSATADIKANRANVESNISSLITHKQDMMTKLSQIRTLYELELKSLQEVQAKYDSEHKSVEQVKQELEQAEKSLRELKSERDQLQANTQKDREDTFDIKRRIRIAEEETVSIKAEIEKLKKDSRQQKGFLAINRKQLAAVEGEKEKASKTLQSLEDKDLSSQDVNDPFGTGVFSPLAFSPSNTAQMSGIIASQSTTEKGDFNESGSIQKSSGHSHHGSLSSIGDRSGIKRSMSNASTASTSTLGTSSIKSAPLHTNKSDEPSFDKPITIASSKPSEFENLLSDKLSSTPQEITANTNVAESNKIVNPFDSVFSGPFDGTNNDQANKPNQNNEESTTQQDTVKENEKFDVDPFSNLNNVPTSGKSDFDSAFSTFNASNNDNLNSDFSKEFPTLEQFDSDFTNLATNNEKKDENLTNQNNLMETIQNEKSEITHSTETTVETASSKSSNNAETKNDNKDISNTTNKEPESPFSTVADSTVSAETAFPPLQDSDAWVSIESSATKPTALDDFAFGDLTEAKVTQTPPIEFDAGFDDADFEDVNFTFDAPTTSAKLSSTNNNNNNNNNGNNNNNNTATSSTTGSFAKASTIDFDKAFGDFDPLSPSNKPKANLDAAFGSISAEPYKIGFDDAFAFPEFTKPDKQTTPTAPTKASTATDDDIDDVKRLTALGYPREKVIDALERNNYDFEKSVNYLVDHS